MNTDPVNEDKLVPHRILFEQQFEKMVPAILGPIANSLERREDGLYKQIAVEAIWRGFCAALRGNLPDETAELIEENLLFVNGQESMGGVLWTVSSGYNEKKVTVQSANLRDAVRECVVQMTQ